MRLKDISISILFLTVFIGKTVSQELRFTFQQVENDVIIGRFKDVIQDEKGILWLTSDNGIVRYNTKEARAYPGAFNSNYTKSFIKGDNDEILVVHDNGIGKIKTENRERMFEPDALGIDSLLHYPKTIYRSSDGTYWIGEDSTLVSVHKGKFKRYDMGFNWHSISYLRTYSMIEDGFGNLWAFSYYGKVYALNNESDSFEEVEESPEFNQLSWAWRKGLNKIWIGCATGIYELTIGGKRSVTYVQTITDLNNVSTFRFIDEDLLLVGTWSEGLYLLQLTDGGAYKKKIEQVEFQDIMQIFPDQESGYWILSSEQLGLLNTSPFRYVEVDPSHNMIRSVGKARDGQVIVSNGYTISILKKNSTKTDIWERVYSHNLRNLHFYMAYYYDDIIAAGDNYGQVFFIYPETGNFEKIEGIKEGAEIGWLFEDLENRIWVCGNTDVGLYRVDRNKNVKIFSQPGLREIYTLREGPDGKIFAAGGNIKDVLYKYDYNTDMFSAIELENSIKRERRFVTEDLLITRDTIFMATSSGFYYVLRKDEYPWKMHKINIPAFGNSVYLKAIARTNDGAIWIASETGLIRYKNEDVQFFDQTSGLPTRIIRFRGLEVDDYGDLWIATEKGLTYLSVETPIADKTIKPQIAIVEIGTDNELFSQSADNYHFAHGSNLELRYLSRSFPQKFVYYQVRIPELNTNWGALNKESQLRFMNFDHGNYTLQVRAIAKGHKFSDINEVHFSVAKPWYQSSWFYLGLIISVSFLTFGIWLIYKRRLEGYGHKIKTEVNNRNMILNKEKDDKIAGKDHEIESLNRRFEKDKSLHETEKSLLNTELRYRELNNNKIKGELELKKKQLTSQTLRNIQKDQTLKRLVSEVNTVMKHSPENVQDKLRKVLRMMDQNTILEKDWDSFRLYFEEIHIGFNEKLKANFPGLTPQDLRHCALIRANLSTNETSTLLGISPESVKTSRYRLKKKLNLNQDQGLLDFLISL